MEQFTVTFLPVAEDFARFKTEEQKQRMPRAVAILIQATAALVIAVSLYFLFFIPNNSSDPGNILLIVIGLIALALPDVLLPWMTYRRALKKASKDQDSFISKTVTVTRESLRISSDRLNLELPYKMLYKSAETPALFLIFLGSDDILYIPKRVMNPEQTEFIRQRLSCLSNGTKVNGRKS